MDTRTSEEAKEKIAEAVTALGDGRDMEALPALVVSIRKASQGIAEGRLPASTVSDAVAGLTAKTVIKAMRKADLVGIHAQVGRLFTGDAAQAVSADAAKTAAAVRAAFEASWKDIGDGLGSEDLAAAAVALAAVFRTSGHEEGLGFARGLLGSPACGPDEARELARALGAVAGHDRDSLYALASSEGPPGRLGAEALGRMVEIEDSSRQRRTGRSPAERPAMSARMAARESVSRMGRFRVAASRDGEDEGDGGGLVQCIRETPEQMVEVVKTAEGRIVSVVTLDAGTMAPEGRALHGKRPETPAPQPVLKPKR